MKLVLCCLIAILVLAPPSQAVGLEYFSKEIKCLVCQVSVFELNRAIRKVNPGAVISTASYKLDNPNVKSKPLVTSEVYLTEAMENVCEKMDDYVRAWYRGTRELTLLKLADKDNENKMSDIVNEVEFVQDGDLNRSLPHFCAEVLEDHEEAFLDYYMHQSDLADAAYTLCHEKANYCNAKLNGIYGGSDVSLKLQLE